MKTSWVIGCVMLWLLIFACEMMATGGVAFAALNLIRVADVGLRHPGLFPTLLLHPRAVRISALLPDVNAAGSYIGMMLLVVLALTLGLAPFRPPHIVEKLQMLFRGTLVRPIDWFDLLLHAAPWLLLLLKAAVSPRR